jgi:hypothetical protein
MWRRDWRRRRGVGDSTLGSQNWEQEGQRVNRIMLGELLLVAAVLVVAELVARVEVAVVGDVTLVREETGQLQCTQM